MPYGAMLCRGIKLCFRGVGAMLLMRQSNALKTVELCFWIVRAMLSKQKAVVLWGTRAVICREESYVFKWFKAAPLIHRVRHREWRKGGQGDRGTAIFCPHPPHWVGEVASHIKLHWQSCSSSASSESWEATEMKRKKRHGNLRAERLLYSCAINK